MSEKTNTEYPADPWVRHSNRSTSGGCRCGSMDEIQLVIMVVKKILVASAVVRGPGGPCGCHMSYGCSHHGHHGRCSYCGCYCGCYGCCGGSRRGGLHLLIILTLTKIMPSQRRYIVSIVHICNVLCLQATFSVIINDICHCTCKFDLIVRIKHNTKWSQ